MAQPARTRHRPGRPPDDDSAPPLDPTAVQRAYRLERAKRRARAERAHERRLAAFRFVSVMLLLVTLAALLVITIWNQIEQLFGL